MTSFLIFGLPFEGVLLSFCFSPLGKRKLLFGNGNFYLGNANFYRAGQTFISSASGRLFGRFTLGKFFFESEIFIRIFNKSYSFETFSERSTKN